MAQMQKAGWTGSEARDNHAISIAGIREERVWRLVC
jgi:hypothetical protein